MRSPLSAVCAWLRRILQACTDDESVPIDQRPTVRLKNIKTRQYRSRLPNSFYMHLDGKTIVLVYGDTFIEHEFDDISQMHAEVQFLQSNGVKKVDILLGFLKLTVFFALFAIFLKMILFIKALG